MNKFKNFRKGCLIGLVTISVLCLGIVGVSWWSNQHLPQPPDDLSHLSDLDKARLAEALHLKRALGETIWPGWGEMAMPVIIWNRSYSFLTGVDEAPAGWEVVPDDSFEGRAYFRQVTDNPQNFAVQVGDQWAGSMATKADTDVQIQKMFRDFLPPVIEDVFPYRVLMMPSEVQMTGTLHEIFHAYQSTVVLERLEEAELTHQQGDSYWACDVANAPEWRDEIRALSQAIRTDSDDEARQLITKFLTIRANRRQTYQLNQALTDYERQLEWEEGLAKYVELASWENAWQALDEYSPLPEILADPDFQGYETFEKRWNQESGINMTNSASQSGETRFYYTGMAQAFLLDRFAPGWKQRILSEDVYLEDLLARAIE